jgi:Cu(I)/Ag(I) efflux system membrane protein CusA/SilA
VRYATIALVVLLLTIHWRPVESSLLLSLLFVVVTGGTWLFFFHLVLKFYRPMLSWCLDHKKTFLALPVTLVILGALAWGSLGREFMPRASACSAKTATPLKP